jgi:FdhE protein
VIPETDNEVFLKRLEAEGKRREFPPRFVEFYQKLFRIQSGAESRIGQAKVVLTKEEARQRLINGSPLLVFDELSPDWALVQDILAQVVTLFTEYSDLLGELPRNLKEMKPYPSLAKEVAKAWFEPTKLTETTTFADANEYLLFEAIIHATLKPFLVSQAKALITLVDQENWRREYCPICGGRPDFAFLDKERGSRWLMCSRCDTQWLYQRLQCPYCRTQNPDALYFFTDDTGLYRLYVCNQCHKYIKAVDPRCSESEISLPLERIFTLDMDRQAEEKGYRPGHSPAQVGTTE